MLVRVDKEIEILMRFNVEKAILGHVPHASSSIKQNALLRLAHDCRFSEKLKTIRVASDLRLGEEA